MKYFSVAFASVVLFFALGTVSAQTELEEIDLSDDVWKEIVTRVLKQKFMPAKSPKTVEIYEGGLRWEWLPSIRNVSFVLLSRKEIVSREISVHFFKSKARRGSDGEISIDFGFGDPFCSASGSTWSFKESLGPRSLTSTAGGWGMGCSHGIGH